MKAYAAASGRFIDSEGFGRYPSQTTLVLEQIADRRQLVFSFGGVDVVRNRYQADIVLREKFLGQPANLNIVAAKTGKVLDEYGGRTAFFKLTDHIHETGAIHRYAGNAIVQEMYQVGVYAVAGATTCWT